MKGNPSVWDTKSAATVESGENLQIWPGNKFKNSFELVKKFPVGPVSTAPKHSKVTFSKGLA